MRLKVRYRLANSVFDVIFDFTVFAILFVQLMYFYYITLVLKFLDRPLV